MSEILFRGKRIDTGEWITGSLAKWCDYFYIADATCEDVSTQGAEYEPKWLGGWYRVIPETIGQYTGLDDKNGVKIFVGDEVIANGHQSPDIVYRVPVFHAATKYFIENYSDEFHKPNIIVEVVGNIHDAEVQE